MLHSLWCVYHHHCHQKEILDTYKKWLIDFILLHYYCCRWSWWWWVIVATSIFIASTYIFFFETSLSSLVILLLAKLLIYDPLWVVYIYIYIYKYISWLSLMNDAQFILKFSMQRNLEEDSSWVGWYVFAFHMGFL